MATYTTGAPVAALDTEARAQFVLRTYIHLFGAILLFAGIEYALFMSGVAQTIAQAMLSTSWLLVLGGFVVVGMLASSTAHRATSPLAQYAALAGYVAAEALIFVPLLYVAAYYVGPDVINKAAWVTLLGFAGLTGVVFMTRKDFSFLGSIIRFGGIMALVLIVVSVLFGFDLGTWFSVGMIALAGGAILYNTSNILHNYPEDRYVAAALELFASVALMFWYVLRLFMSRR